MLLRRVSIEQQSETDSVKDCSYQEDVAENTFYHGETDRPFKTSELSKWKSPERILSGPVFGAAVRAVVDMLLLQINL